MYLKGEKFPCVHCWWHGGISLGIAWFCSVDSWWGHLQASWVRYLPCSHSVYGTASFWTKLCHFHYEFPVLTFPYSKVKETCLTSPGSFPFLRTGTKGTFRARESRVPNRNPRASRPTTTSMTEHLVRTRSSITSIKSWNTDGLPRTGKMSLGERN